jgi:DUF1365 family protein
VNSCLYEGRVRHERFAPIRHGFAYRVFYCYLELGELPELFDGLAFWSQNESNLASFWREDHLGARETSLDTAVRDLVEDALGRRPGGAIRLLTHLRYFGYGMNPVSFYYCYTESGEQAELDAIVAEVNNTPWGEQHPYVLDAREARRASPGHMRFRFAKDFHVSPFFPMEQSYDWRFNSPGEQLSVRMDNIEEGERVFLATMALERRAWTKKNLRRVLLRYPLMTTRVVAAIYWQALRLKLRGAIYHPHPRALAEQSQDRDGDSDRRAQKDSGRMAS